MKLLNKVDFPLSLSHYYLLYIKEELKLAFSNYSLSLSQNAWRKKYKKSDNVRAINFLNFYFYTTGETEKEKENRINFKILI